MSDLTLPQAALIAAAQASEATTELIRYHREGPAGWTAFGDIEVIEKLAEALALAINLELPNLDPASGSGETEALLALQAAAKTYIVGWAS